MSYLIVNYGNDIKVIIKEVNLLYLPLIFNLIFNPLTKLLFYLFNVVFLLGYKQSLALIGLLFLSHYGIFQN